MAKYVPKKPVNPNKVICDEKITQLKKLLVEDKTQDSISEVLGVSRRTVRSWVDNSLSLEEKESIAKEYLQKKFQYSCEQLDIALKASELTEMELDLRLNAKDKNGQFFSNTKDLRELATTSGIAFDKYIIATGQAKETVEIKLDEKTNSLLEKYLKRQNAKEIEAEPYTDVEYTVKE